MSDSVTNSEVADLFIIGGGINGCGIARDAAGRGLSVVLAEKDDLASATSSASTKMFHGGLRYLEYFEFGLVAKALKEREVLLKAMPHISWPVRFVLPYHKDMRFEGSTPTSRLLNLFMPWMKGRRPSWLIRFGLFLYDSLGGRQKFLPGTNKIDLKTDPTGAPLDERFRHAFEYSDCWVQDSRLVALNARDACQRGAKILTRTEVVRADRENGLWRVCVHNIRTGEDTLFMARALVNAGGPWVADIVSSKLRLNSKEGIRLVRGSHIVTKRLFDHNKAYFLQGTDGRVIFVIPYEEDFTLIGTTEADHSDLSQSPECSDQETDYLCAFVSDYFKKPVGPSDIVWSYSGVRPLYDDGASSATAATRDYVLSLDQSGENAPLLNVFGGKITTYRKLAENALAKLSPFFPDTTQDWTAEAAMPGGDFPVEGVEDLIQELHDTYPFLDGTWARRLVKTYGTDATNILAGAEKSEDLGHHFGATLTEREVVWLMDKEFAQRAVDIVWRRTRLGLRLSNGEIEALDQWMIQASSAQ